MNHEGVMAVEAMSDESLLIKDINNFINLVGICAGEGNQFIVLRHLIEKVLSVRAEDVTFRLLRTMAKDLYYVNNKSRSLVYGLSKIGIGSHC
jgi:hypothetical protein